MKRVENALSIFDNFGLFILSCIKDGKLLRASSFNDSIKSKYFGSTLSFMNCGIFWKKFWRIFVSFFIFSLSFSIISSGFALGPSLRIFTASFKKSTILVIILVIILSTTLATFPYNSVLFSWERKARNSLAIFEVFINSDI